ncbi:MAG: hypothetical protein ACJAUH_001417 [Saprospiraceae bacterium]|jgi:hypothetical protein|tara:strand:- start:390 stop:890 length:501 start_codon:yes stop_codon:yes gene_type:complete
MKNVLYIGIFFLCSLVTCKTPTLLPEETNSQDKYLFQELLDSNLYLGMPREDFLMIRPNTEYNSDVHNFRSIYVEENFSPRFQTLICYLDNDGEQPLYEFILILSPKLDAKKIASDHFGLPNHKEKEWRFLVSETGVSYSIAAWTYKNKIIIAATLAGTEWEEGIE